MKSWFRNLKLVLWSWPSVIIGLIFAWWLAFMIEQFSDRALIAGNYGQTYAIINIIMDSITVWGIALFVASLVYKITAFKTIEQTNHFWRIGWFFSALVAGCGSCGLTLATYLGLASFLTLLPRWWLEVKIIGVIILWRSVWKNIKDLLICKIKQK